MRVRYHLSAMALLAATILLGFAAGAWACVPQPLLAVEPQASGPPGSQLTVRARDMPGMISEVRWNSAEGPILATAESSRDFSVPVTVPDVAPGLYALIAVARYTEGNVAGTGRAAFLVTGPNGAAAQMANSGSSARATPTAGEADATSDSVLGLALGGAGLLALGGVGGKVLSRRRGHGLPV